MATGVILVGAVLVALCSIRLMGQPSDTLDHPPTEAAARAVVSVRRRLWLMFGIAAIVTTALVVFGLSEPASFGLVLAIAPGTAAAIALLSFIVYPSPRPAPRRVRSASLEPRTPSRYLPRRSVVGPLVAAAGLMMFLLYAGSTASADDAGLSRSIAREDEMGQQAAGPFPGWYYGVPLMLLTCVLAALTVLAVWRIAAAPAEPDARARAFDTRWRQHTSQLVVLMSTTTLLAYSVGVLFFAGTATMRVATSLDQYGETALHMGTMVLGWMETLCAVALLLLAAWLVLGIVERLRRFAFPAVRAT